ncbi:MAG: choice-of-anchor Q domain-containing protein [Gemmataceae bacterium]
MIRTMWFRRLHRWMVSRPTSPIRKRSDSAARPRLEQLEDRTLLNAYVVNLGGDVGKSSGTLTGDIRYCVEQADLNPGSTITFDTAAIGSNTIQLSHGELQVAVNMTITGPGANSLTISGTDGKGGASRVFDITSSAATVAISGLTIANGNANVYYTSVPGNQGGDIFNAGTLTLTNDVVQNGLSQGLVGGPPGRGGGIFNAEGNSGTTGATLYLDSTLIQNNEAEGLGGGAGGLGAGGGVYNDVNATTIVNVGSQFLNNQAVGSPGPNGPLYGGNGLTAGPAEGGGIFNAGSLQINGTSATSIIFTDNVAQGGLGGAGAIGFSPPTKGPGGDGGNGGAGGAALGGGVYNTSSALTLQYVKFLGDLANGGAGGIGGDGGNAKGSTGGLGFNGGNGGAAGLGGYAQGGGIYNGTGALALPNIVFGTDSGGTGNEANAAAGGNGGNGGNGSAGGTLGGNGGNGGAGGAAGFARGGAMSDLGGSVSYTNTSFASSQANGGGGGNGGSGGIGGNGGVGGNGGNAAIAGAGGLSEGGAVFNQSGNLSFSNDPLTASEANGGSGGVGGNGGLGGNGGGGAVGFNAGNGGLGAGGGVGGAAQGGGFYNITGTVTISNSSFTANTAGVGDHAASGNGGNGGNGGAGGIGGNASTGKAGNGGNGGGAGSGGGAGLAEGGAGGNQGSHESITNSTFSSDFAQSGFGGIGGNGGFGGNGGNNTSPAFGLDGYGGAGGNAGDGGNSANAFGGAIAVTTSDLTVYGSAFGLVQSGGALINQAIGGAGGAGGIGGTVGKWGNNPSFYYPTGPINTGVETAGNGGAGGLGAFVFGGAISVSSSAQAVTISNTSFNNNAITSGNGGAGGPGGLFSLDGKNKGFNGAGGNAGPADGGTLYFSSTTAQNAILTSDAVTGSTATAGVGGAGAINVGPITPKDGNGFGSVGGIGGSVQGVGIDNIDYNLSITSTSFLNGTGQAGIGGAGGSASVLVPYSWAGGAGANGGNVQGGGVYFSNNLPQTTLSLSYNGGSVSSYTLLAGNGGAGGNAGASGSKSVTGGAGGNGGTAQGGGLYMLTGGNSVTLTSLSNLNVIGDVLSAGFGGIGGAGYNSVGGSGGEADGGGLYNNSVNTVKPSSLGISASTFAAEQVIGGVGGRAGSATTPNGGAGGPGGNGGGGFGGALYNGNNTPLSVINSTLGGSGFSVNTVTAGRGGRGGDAGTPAKQPANNGGPGGNGGSVAGGNVYIASNTAQFLDDTIVYGQASAYGVGGAGGGGAGTGGQPGPAGANGTGNGGGYFAASGSTNTIANTIIDLDTASTAGADVSGAFISMNNAGHNILGSSTGSTGFSPSFGDKIGVTAAQLNLGPLQNNGGPTLTNALLAGSAAIGAGNNALVPSTLTTDQRGTGFARITFGTVDVGAFQVQVPSPPPGPPGPPSPPPGPPAPPSGSNLTTTTTIVSVQNTYPGFFQLETVTVDVTNPNGFVVNQGVVTFQVNGQTVVSAVHNGVAVASIATGLFDFGALYDLLFPHTLTAGFSDSLGGFAMSGTGTTVPAIWIDFLFSLLASQSLALTQLQTP